MVENRAEFLPVVVAGERVGAKTKRFICYFENQETVLHASVGRFFR